jgi:hypothetical protein
MKTLIDPQKHESILTEWRGAQAKIWIFHVSHNRLALCLFRTGEHEVIYIVAIGCEHISGPFSWKEADVEIITDPPNQWGEIRYRVVDKKAGFELLCSGVAIARGPEGVPESPFENFLDDTK